MWIYSPSVAALFLILSTFCEGKKAYDNEDLTTLLGDLKSVESEEQRSILKSLTGSEDTNIAEESRQIPLTRIDPPKKRKSHSHHRKKVNGTNKNYDMVQWYATPTRIVEHRVESGKLESNIDSYNDNGDLNHHGSNAYDDGNHDHHDDQYHADHHHDDEHSGEDENQNGYTSFHHQNDGGIHDVPTSDLFYKKMKLKKVRRNCTRIKVKKSQGWPDRSDINLESRANNEQGLPHINTKSFQHSLPALPEARFNDILKPLNYPMLPLGAMGFSGEHLHGIPRTHFFQYKNGEGVNHYHLHNHNHIYDANGKRINLDYSPQYRNFAQHFGKLKSILTATDAKNPQSYPAIADRYRSTLSLGDSEAKPSLINGGPEKRGYHYTGAHESYGKKTYKRLPPDGKSSPSSSLEDPEKSIGMEMYRYGAGQYGTDEFSSHEEKGPYPNEVSFGLDKSYPNSGETYDPINENPYSSFHKTPSSGSYGGYNSDTSVENPLTPYNGDFGHSHNYDGNKNKYDYNNKESLFESKDKAPFTPQDKAPFTPQDKPSYGSSHTNGPNHANGPSHANGPPSSEFHDGFRGPPSDGFRGPPSDGFKVPPSDGFRGPPSDGFRGPPSDGFRGPPSDAFRHPIPYPNAFGSSGDKNEPSGPSSSKPDDPASHENTSPPSVDVTHSVSYSQDGDIETVDLGPGNMHLYQNLQPDIDPLTIPKNARVFEHHIRLHPMHYMHAAMAGRPMNIPTPFGNAGYPVPLPKYPTPLPKYPVPLHKLMPNPLKMPMFPAVPLYPRIPIPQLNPMLHAYHGRSLYYGMG